MNKTILIIDDEALVRKALARLFSSQGHKVYEAENGSEGLTLFFKHQPDLIFLDLMMPIMTGIEFLKELKRQNQNLSSIVLMSAVQDISEVPFLSEIKKFIPKPFDNIFSLKELSKQ
jgi:CheY-like chemotaxis protein